ncbi:thiamine phosphate synthase [Acetoanaerobium sticklandii]|uniref:thiamine phosphate synthase n=1 Tax=Acetoanaerobium sticklandii TaxID=1511 RepID=UPI003A8CEC50
MYSFKNICITNRHISKLSLVKQLELIITKSKPDLIILREKDLDKVNYKLLASYLIKLCDKNNIDINLHTYVDIALSLNHKKIHLSYTDFIYNIDKNRNFQEIGVSVHSVEEAINSSNNGATYIIAGHIFSTDCKKNLKPKGEIFIKEIIESVNIPVYAIGGINFANIEKIKNVGANGACMMSEYMNMI